MTHVDQLAKTIETNPIPMAVVDYAGMSDGDGMIYETSPWNRRYGTRDMRHVKLYNLKVLRRNAAARG